MKKRQIKKGKISEEFVKEFLNFIDSGEATTKTYANALKQLYLYLSKNNISIPIRDNIISFREYLKKENKRPSTIQLYIVAARRFFEWMETAGYCDNITAGVKGPKTGSDFVKACLTESQAFDLLNGIDKSSLIGKRDYALITLMLTTGMRTIEVVRANRSDIRKLGTGSVLFIQGKGHDAKDNYVKLTNEAAEALRIYLDARTRVDPSPVLFSSLSRRRSERITTRSIRRIVKQRLKAIGLDDYFLSAHSLRHTAATLNLKNGGSLEETKQLLRHRNINTTLRYSHALERASNQSETRIASAIFGKKI